MYQPHKQTEFERRQHLQALVLLGSLIIQIAGRSEVQRQFVVFSATAT